MRPGTYTALITPFDEKGRLDEEGLRFLIQRQIAASITGILLLGTTGEAPTLTKKECARVIEIGVEEAKGKAPLLIGTGTYCTQTTIDATRHAKEMGADGALLILPYYNRPMQEGIYRHIAAIDEATQFSIIVYNHPGRTGISCSVDSWQQIIQLPSVIAIKECLCNHEQATELAQLLIRERPDCRLLTGVDEYTLPFIALGGHGIISVVSNLFPQEMMQYTQAALDNDFALARKKHYELWPLFMAMSSETNPIPVKEAAAYLKLPSGGCRLPMTPMEPQRKEALHALLDQYQTVSVCE